jgi:hypothetical protein
MKNIFLPFISFILVSFYGCNNHDSIGSEVLFYWNQTRCADPWNTVEGD